MQVIRTSTYDHDTCFRSTRYTVYLNGTEYNIIRRAINVIALPDDDPAKEIMRKSLSPVQSLDQARMLIDIATHINQSI